MSDLYAEQVALTRSRLPTSRAHIDAKEVERAVFGVFGHRALALQIWTDAHAAAVDSWRECRRRMRQEYGPRSPHGSWAMFTLFGALLAGAYAAAVASGILSDPDDAEVLLTILLGVSAVADLTVLAAIGWRPWNWAAVRMQIGLAITLGAAAVFQLNHLGSWATPLAITGGVIGVGGMLLVLTVRALRPEERFEIDTVINVAVAKMQRELDARTTKMQAETTAALGPEDAERIIAVRSRVFADLAADGITLESVPENAPAGGVMITALTAHWHPYSRLEK